MTAAPTPALEVRDVSKRFPGVRALDEVSLTVAPGEIHALVGENGAGKSTLMKIIAGLESPDRGIVELGGEAVEGGRADGRQHKRVGMVHQERSLVENLSVAENIFAGRRGMGLMRWRRLGEEARAIFAQLEESVPPDAKVGSLSPARQQVVEIAKALAVRPAVLILDEPTAALTLTETDHLFALLRRLREDGVAIVYISHRLAEVFELADRVTVLKDGVVTGTHPIGEVDEDRLIRLMVGRELVFERSDTGPPADAPVALEVRGIASPPEVVDVSFSLRRGEILCLAGLIGAGRTECCEAIFGVRPLAGGEILIDGESRRIPDATTARKLGLGMVPEERKTSGLFLEFSIVANVLAPNLDRVTRRGVISSRRANELARDIVERLGVVAASVDQPVGKLSGGNQQKLLLGRWLLAEPEVLIVDEPTRGVDIGARAQIYEVLRELAAKGMAIIVVSSDLAEVLTLAHRIVVFREGRTVAQLEAENATEEQILRRAAIEAKEVAA